MLSSQTLKLLGWKLAFAVFFIPPLLVTPSPTSAPSAFPSSVPSNFPPANNADLGPNEITLSMAARRRLKVKKKSLLLNKSEQIAFCNVMVVTLAFKKGTVVDCTVTGQSAAGGSNIIVQFLLSIASSSTSLISNAASTVEKKLSDPVFLSTVVVNLQYSGVPALAATYNPRASVPEPSSCAGLSEKKCHEAACCKFKKGMCKVSRKCDDCNPLSTTQCNKATCCKKKGEVCKTNKKINGCKKRKNS